MKIFLFVSMLMVLFTTALTAQKTHDQLVFPEINRFQMPDVITFELPNGVRFYLVEDKELPLINVNVRVRAGSYMDPADKVGLAGMTGEIMRSGGTSSYPFNELNSLLEMKAASIESSFGQTNGTVSMSVLKEDFEELLPVFIDVLKNPAFPDERITLTKTQRNSTISRRNDNAMSVAGREFLKLIYGTESPFARSSEYATIDAVMKDDVIAFHRRVVVGNNMYVGVIGDFDASTMKRQLESAFSTIAAGTRNTLDLPSIDYVFEPSVNFVAKNDVNQSTIYLGHIGGRRSNPDYAALQLMNEILSGGFSGRLLQVIRTDLGLAYNAGGVYQSSPLFDGAFFITLGTASANTAKAVEASIEEVNRLQRDAVTQKELDDAKDRILNSLVFRYTSRASVLFEQIANEYNGLPADAFNIFIDELTQVTVEDIQRVANQYLRPDAMKVLVVGNENEIGDQLFVLGNVNHIDITIPRPEAPRTERTGDSKMGREVLQKMASAIIAEGTAFSSVTFNGSVNLGGMNLNAKIRMTPPSAYIQEITSPQGVITIALENGSAVMRAGPGEQPLPPMQAEALQNELDRHYVSIAMNANELDVDFVGLDDDGLANIFLPDLSLNLFINMETGLPAKMVVKEFNPMAGQEVESVVSFDNWTSSNGVTLAYSTSSTANGQVAGGGTITSHEVE
jgi:zinc protease